MRAATAPAEEGGWRVGSSVHLPSSIRHGYPARMEITWLGHCCFRIRAKEATVVTDPCDKSTGYTIGRPTADLVTVSAHDPGHDNIGGVAGDPRVIDAPGEFEIA